MKSYRNIHVRKIKPGFYLLGLALLIIILAPFFLTGRLIKVNIRCSSQFGKCPESIEAPLASRNNKSYTEVKNEIKKILEEELLVSEYSVQYKLPRTLDIRVIIKKPGYVIYGKTDNASALVDSDGLVLDVSENQSLPGIIVESKVPEIGEKITSEYLNALEIMAGVYRMYGVRTGEVAEKSLNVELPGPIGVIFPVEDGEVEVLLGSLRLVYTKAQDEAAPRKYSQIDLRFKNPVLR